MKKLALILLLLPIGSWATDPKTFGDGVPREGYWSFNDSSDTSVGLNEGTITIQGRLDSLRIYVQGQNASFQTSFTTGTLGGPAFNVVKSSVIVALAASTSNTSPLIITPHQAMYAPWIVFRQLTAGTTVHVFAEYSQYEDQVATMPVVSNIR